MTTSSQCPTTRVCCGIEETRAYPTRLARLALAIIKIVSQLISEHRGLGPGSETPCGREPGRNRDLGQPSHNPSSATHHAGTLRTPRTLTCRCNATRVYLI